MKEWRPFERALCQTLLCTTHSLETPPSLTVPSSSLYLWSVVSVQKVWVIFQIRSWAVKFCSRAQGRRSSLSLAEPDNRKYIRHAPTKFSHAVFRRKSDIRRNIQLWTLWRRSPQIWEAVGHHSASQFEETRFLEENLVALFLVDSAKNLDDPPHGWCIQRRFGAAYRTIAQEQWNSRPQPLGVLVFLPTPIRKYSNAVKTSHPPPALAPISQIRTGGGMLFPLSNQSDKETDSLLTVILFPPIEGHQLSRTRTANSNNHDVAKNVVSKGDYNLNTS